MTDHHAYPGTPQHQALLRRIVTYYRDDPRVLALALFGSLARGTWDQYSDLDLDVVIRDDAQLDALPEAHALCETFTAIGERAVLVVPDKADAVDVVLASLRELSIRYHPLATTSPNIVESVQVLSGQLSVEQVKTAGTRNIRPHLNVEADPVDAFLRFALAVNREFHRRRFWQALSSLDNMRTLVIEMFARAHGGGRPYNVFQTHAPPVLQEQLAATLPHPTLAPLREAFLRLLDVVEREQRLLGREQGLSAEHETILAELKRRHQGLTSDDF